MQNMQIMQIMQIAKCWSFLHSAFRMEKRQCTNLSVLRVEVLQLSKRIFKVSSLFVLDIYCQQLGNICQLNLYIGIGYILQTGGYMSIGGFQCALRAQSRMCIFWNIYILEYAAKMNSGAQSAWADLPGPNCQQQAGWGT